MIFSGSVSGVYAQKQSGFENYHTSFYSALISESINQIESQLLHLGRFSHNDSLAFSGALKMKLAGLQTVPAEKLKLFRRGRQQLEKAIADDSLNVEYRFLRLIIQENSPSIMRYKSDQEKDKAHILENYHKVDSYLRMEIKKYSLTSHILPESSLKNSSR
jgi:hypothetical protein